MKAKIFKPARTAMQSGEANTKKWRLVFVPDTPLFTDPLMGWTGQIDTTQQVQLRFSTKEEAVEYAKNKGIEYDLDEPKQAKIKPKSYAANFAYNRVS